MKMIATSSSIDVSGVMLRYVQPGDDQLGLLDGGATNPLREGSPRELRESRMISVELATGSTMLAITESGTLLSSHPITPIVPLGKVIEQLKCVVDWKPTGFELHHPCRGKLPAVLVRGCPMIARGLALELIRELEFQAEKEQVRLRAIDLISTSTSDINGSLEVLLRKTQGSEEARLVALAAFARRLFPEVPEELLEQLIPLGPLQDSTGFTYTNSGLNRRTRRRV